ncbi:hypothetical protein EXN66_Car014131 [Channa argus]|uniref:Uncharacterized protein n=1 Tax=Channa argus TaxID=215402 RepID=A0A6G1Q733_CHAAH|nr:hypothetical protein EXN66_Car014131 [Channa argus]
MQQGGVSLWPKEIESTYEDMKEDRNTEARQDKPTGHERENRFNFNLTNVFFSE